MAKHVTTVTSGGVDARHVALHGTTKESADTALRLARYFGTTPRFWLNLQGRFDLDTELDRLGPRLAEEVVIRVR